MRRKEIKEKEVLEQAKQDLEKVKEVLKKLNKHPKRKK